MKAIKILIFTIIGVLLIGAVAIGLIYFYTDTFKTNQEIFYKYFSEKDATEILDSTFTSQFLTKIATNANEQNVKITVNGSTGGETFVDGQTVVLNNKIDNPNKKMESQIVFGNGQDDNLLEFGIVRNSDIYGLKIKDVINQYMALENNNLQDFSSKLGLGETDIPDKIEVKSYSDKVINVQNDSTTFCKDLYNALKSETSKKNYAKIGKTTVEINGKKIEAVGYELNLKADEFKNVLGKIKQTDNLGVLNTVISQILGTDDINNLKLGLSTKIYLQNKKLVKIDISIQDENKTQTIGISKTSNNLILQINSNEGMQISADLTRNGDINSDKINYAVTLGIISEKDSMQLDLGIEADFTFNSNLQITELNDENSVKLNDIDGERIIKLLQVVIQKTQSDTGFNDTILGSLVSLISQVTGNITSTSNQTTLQTVKVFNSRFVAYEGEQSGKAIKTLTSVIETSNGAGENQVEITYNGGTDEINIEDSKKYKVSFEYDDNGYINMVNIDE